MKNPDTERIDSLLKVTRLESSRTCIRQTQEVALCLKLPDCHPYKTEKPVRSVTASNSWKKFAEKGQREIGWGDHETERQVFSFNAENTDTWIACCLG